MLASLLYVYFNSATFSSGPCYRAGPNARQCQTLQLFPRLLPQDVIGVQQAEAARGPPRSLHGLARDALHAMCNRPTRDAVILRNVSHGDNTLRHTGGALKSFVQALRMRSPCLFQAPMTQIVVARNVWTSASTGRMALSVDFTQAGNPGMTPNWSSPTRSESSGLSQVAVDQRSFSGCCCCAPERFSAMLFSLPSDLELVASERFVPTELRS